MGKRIKGRIFMGGGQATEADCYYLHERLNEALTEISGMQQSGDFSEDKYVAKIAQEISLALTGKKIKLEAFKTESK
jgi:hypothetical protein